MAKTVFFTPEMGARLRELRVKKGFTQDKVAEWMGLTYEDRARFISSLETGHEQNPTLSLVTRYLRAVGAKWTDLADLLDKVELPQLADLQVKKVEAKVNVPPSPSAAPIHQPRYAATTTPAEEVIALTEKETRSYMERVVELRTPTPIAPENQQQAVKNYQQGRLKLNVALRKTRDYLNTITTMSALSLGWYQTISNRVYGVLSRSTKVKDAAKRAAKRAKEMTEALDYARACGLDMTIVERIQAIVTEVFESWQAGEPTANS